ncbi:MAG TPA: hypothetical protein VK436_10990 [Methanocella sp.]|nr:hypothetical protein [Methanocella sp.]
MPHPKGSQDSFEIGVCADAGAEIARVFIDGEWPGDPGEAKSLLNAVCERLRGSDRLGFLVLFGGFLNLPWPEKVRRGSIIDPVWPSGNVVEQLAEYGTVNVKAMLHEGGLQRKLKRIAGCVTIGVDVYYFMGSVRDLHAELIFAIDVDNGGLWRTGKSYPNPRQQCGLVRFPGLPDHFVSMGGRKVMVLGCHDLNMFSPRSAHNARGWRSTTIEEFRRLATSENPDLLLWHPHKSDTPRTWLAGLSGVKKLLPDISYAGAGVFYNDGRPPRASLARVLGGTKNVPTIDLIVKRDNPLAA